MDRAEQTGLGAAVVGHVVLLAFLSLSFVSTARLPPLSSDALDVSLVDEVAIRSAAPQASAEAPAPTEAPELGPPDEATPAEPAPAEPAPNPRASEVPVVPKPTPKPEPKRDAKALPDMGDRRRPDRNAKATPKIKPRDTGSRLGPDFLKGISDNPKGTGRSPRAAEISESQKAGLAAALYRQFKPCYDLGSLGGTPAMTIQTVLRLRYKPDGTVGVTPELIEQTGVNGGNQAYARQMAEAARRAVQRCSPVRLPVQLYEGGWDDFELNFVPGDLG